MSILNTSTVYNKTLKRHLVQFHCYYFSAFDVYFDLKPTHKHKHNSLLRIYIIFVYLPNSSFFIDVNIWFYLLNVVSFLHTREMYIVLVHRITAVVNKMVMHSHTIDKSFSNVQLPCEVAQCL